MVELDDRIIKGGKEKREDVIFFLRKSFDSLNKGRNVQNHHKLMTKEFEDAYQKVGKSIMDLARAIKNYEAK